ncbi:hypothetical protein QMO14_05190 [Variovorax sp. CAN2819]|uniref:PASTA domain-containing protein n=1 Tax=Variovorax sp. CAN15 TaxID=3046727 RepID=UPI0026495055|nr:Stk1 family PASTA domain-containing Ser/Thr kinase [Variovorax sp. CAN15]MDN6882995.1 hypothetical protein [Variovorax sp. CAN15]
MSSLLCLPAFSAYAALSFSLALALPATAQIGASAPRVQSDLKDIRMKAIASLPKAGGSASDRDGCPWRVAKPKSATAKLVAAQGWAVMADVPLGAYRAVGFAGRMEPGTSGTCNITQGNVALFDGDRLFALAYGKSAEDTSIGNLSLLEGGTVRVWDGDIVGAPVGDLRIDADGTVRLGKLADEESVCNGRAKVPNIYGMPIDKARQALAGKGWKPVRIKPDGESRQAGLIRRGIVEAESCAGTGLAYCSFSYTGVAGTLSLITAGEKGLPDAVGYDVKCR